VEQVDLAVIGAGPAGLSAALTAQAAGLSATVIDENPRPGGQIFRQMPEAFRVARPEALGHTFQKGQALLEKVSGAGIQLRLDTTVWGLFHPLTLALHRGDSTQSLRCRTLILATGAYDRPMPFPGWTLPGVMTLGGAQALVKGQRVLPGARIVLAGSGPFLLPVAAQLLKGGAKIVAILEASKPRSWLGKAGVLWKQWERFREAWEYMRPIAAARVPVRFGQTIVAARGDQALEEVTVASLDREWRPVLGSEYTLEADTACVGFGFSINTQLSTLCGCDHQYKPGYGGWVVSHDSWQRTSAQNVLVAGEATGIAGVDAAVAEGAIAGLGAALALGLIPEAEARRRAAPHRRRLGRMRPFAEMLGELFAPREGLLDLITDETVICRCEEVTAAEVRQAIEGGARDVSGVKSRARAGMGLCQGRVCGPIVAELVARGTGLPVEEVGVFSARPITKPVSLAAIAGME
jgi:NADPH-dependent 2,4-dienoyl-CoA reductase/sulfur reductase-like enzyme